MKNFLFLPLIAFLTVMLISCTVEKRTKKTDVPFPEASVTEKTVLLPKEEQEKKAFEVFNQIFKMTEFSKRSEILDEMIEKYFVIMYNYPDTGLAQESYWRVLEMYLKDFKPPKKDEALILFKEFDNKYPESPLKNIIENSIAKFLYQRGYWEDLLVFETGNIKNFIKTGNLRSPRPMLMYSEAKMKLKDYTEASKGYRIVIKYFPNSRESILSRKRLNEIKEILQEQREEAK